MATDVWGHLRKRPADPDTKLNERPFDNRDQAARFADRMWQLGYTTAMRRPAHRGRLPL